MTNDFLRGICVPLLALNVSFSASSAAAQADCGHKDCQAVPWFSPAATCKVNAPPNCTVSGTQSIVWTCVPSIPADRKSASFVCWSACICRAYFIQDSPPPIVTLTADQTALSTGQSTTLRWNAANNPTACTASGSWSGGKTAAGAEGTGALGNEGSYTYTLSCSNAAGSDSKSVTIAVSAGCLDIGLRVAGASGPETLCVVPGNNPASSAIRIRGQPPGEALDSYSVPLVNPGSADTPIRIQSQGGPPKALKKKP